MLMKQIKDLNKWRNIRCSFIERLNTVMMSVLKLIHWFNAIPSKISARIFVGVDQVI